MRTPESIYNEIKGIVLPSIYIDEEGNESHIDFEQWFKNEINNFGKEQYNQAVKDCVESATAYMIHTSLNEGRQKAIINKGSMLKNLKK